MRKTLNILIIAMGLSMISNAQIKEFTLDQAIKYALENNVNVKNAEIDKKIAQKKVWETTAIGLPQVNGNIDYQYNPEPATMPAFIPGEPAMELGVENSTTYDATVSQLVFSGEYIVGLQASKAYKELSGRSAIKSIRDVRESVSNAYYTVLLIEANKQILDSSLANTNKLLSETKQMHKAGFLEETDVDQLKLIASNLENTLHTLEGQIPIANAFLHSQMGLADSTEIKTTETLDELITKNATLEAVGKEFSLENNIDYQLLETQEKLSILSARREKSTVLPTLAAFYRHKGYLSEEPEINFEPKDLVGVNLSIPIFGSGSRLVKIQQASLEVEKINNTKQMVSQNLTTASEKAKNDYNSTYNIYINEKENLALSNRIYERTQLKYKEGLSSSFELVQAQNQFLTTQSNYHTAAYNLLSAKSQLDKILNN